MKLLVAFLIPVLGTLAQVSDVMNGGGPEFLPSYMVFIGPSLQFRCDNGIIWNNATKQLTLHQPSITAYPINLTSNASKSGDGNYIGFNLLTNDGANNVTASFTYFGDSVISNRRLRIGAFDEEFFTWAPTEFPGVLNPVPGGTAPAWAKYSLVKIANGVNGCANPTGCWQVNGVLTANALASLTQDVALFQLPSNGYVSDWRMKTSVACTGTTTATSGIGTADNNVYFRSATYDIQAAPGAANKDDTVVVKGSTTAVAVNVVASLVTTAGAQFVDTLVDGCAVDYWLLWGVLP